MTERELTSQGTDRRDQLLAVAAEMFAERGFGATRISDIARAAGVAKGLLYWYFPSKEAVLAAVSDDVVQELRSLQAAAMADVDDLLEGFYVAVLVSVEYWHRHYQLFAALSFAQAPAAVTVFAQGVGRHVRDTTAVLVEGQASGVVRSDERPEQLAFAVSALVNELLHFHGLGLFGDSVDEVAALTARLCVHLVAVEPAAARAMARGHERLAQHAALAFDRRGGDA